jgi:hypothetical protein
LTDVKDVVMESDCLNIDQVIELLEQIQLLVPFPAGILKCLKGVGLA